MKLIEYKTLSDLELWADTNMVNLEETNTSVSFRAFCNGKCTELHIFNK